MTSLDESGDETRVRLAEGFGTSTVSRDVIATLTDKPLVEVDAAIEALEEAGYIVDLGDDLYLLRKGGSLMAPGKRTAAEKAVLRALVTE